MVSLLLGEVKLRSIRLCSNIHLLCILFLPLTQMANLWGVDTLREKVGSNRKCWMSLCVCCWFLAYTVVPFKVSDLLRPVNISKGPRCNAIGRGMLYFTSFESFVSLCLVLDRLDFMGTVCISRSGLGWGWLFYSTSHSPVPRNIHSTNTRTNKNPPSNHWLDLHIKGSASLLSQPGAHQAFHSPGLL